MFILQQYFECKDSQSCFVKKCYCISIIIEFTVQIGGSCVRKEYALNKYLYVKNEYIITDFDSYFEEILFKQKWLHIEINI